MASLLTPGAFGGADAGPPSILAPSQKAQPPSILNQGPPSILNQATAKQKKKKPQKEKAKQPDPERTTVPVGDAVAPEPAMARKDKQQQKTKQKKPPKKDQPSKKKASPKAESEQKEAAEPSSPPHYAFSAFQISPEPSSLPKPSFSFGKKKT